MKAHKNDVALIAGTYECSGSGNGQSAVHKIETANLLVDNDAALIDDIRGAGSQSFWS